MERKKILIYIYLAGLLAGAVLMNYIFVNDPDLSEKVMRQFENLDRFQMISGKEYFIYLLSVRIRQLVFLVICYTFFPKYLFLILILLYVSFCLGGFLSLQTYFYGFRGILYGISCFLPHYFCYGLIFYIAVCQAGPAGRRLCQDDRKVVTGVFLIGILGCVLECFVNSSLMIVLYRNK